jgi:3-deoxy-manno-octulosonate cytidylyltransferase (CMP-KDO synthetase)
MIARVVGAALRSPEVERVFVATDHDGIARAAEAAGATAVMTDPALPSGTDRVAAAVRQITDDAPIIVNVQGDEPLLPPEAISSVVRALRVESAADMSTLGCPLERADLLDLNRVKVVISTARRAIYFSRAPVGIPRAVIERALSHADDRADAAGEAPPEERLEAASTLRHLGVYGFRREALFRFVAMPPSPLELVEELEQLRALEAGMFISVARIEAAHRGVDTAEDLQAVREDFEKQSR